MSSRVVRIKAGVLVKKRSRCRRDPRCPKRDPHLWSGRGALKHLLVGSMFSLLAKSLGKGQGGTETFVPLKPVPHMASQSVLGTHMGDHWSVNVATTRYQQKLVKFVGLSLYYTYCKIRTGEDSVRFCLYIPNAHSFPLSPSFLSLSPPSWRTLRPSFRADRLQ